MLHLQPGSRGAEFWGLALFPFIHRDPRAWGGTSNTRTSCGSWMSPFRQTFLQTLSQTPHMCISMAILNSVKLTMKINHHNV